MFEEFVKKIFKELGQELPGFSAQKRMAPSGRKQAVDYSTKNIVPKKSAVLILLYPQVNPFSIKTVLILRPKNEGGNHAGQISFPGGGFDNSDRNMAETALREAEEEIGIDRKLITLLGELTSLYIPVSNFMVHPFVGVIHSRPVFKIHSREVQELLEVEMNDLLATKNATYAEQFMKTSNTVLKVPCYNVNSKIIWGATAMIIAELLEIVRRIK